MGAPQMGAPPMNGAGPPMNMQPGPGMMGGPAGNMPFGNSPNTTMTTAMNSSTMSTTAPPGNTTLMVSNNMMGSTGSAGQGAMSPHKSSNKSLGEAPFGSNEIKEEIKVWATTGSQLGKHA